jgi:acetone carboxylase gamma subunit
MEEPILDIFSGELDKDAMWLESAEGLSQACARMEEIAAAKPGRYFIYSVKSHAVLAHIETFAQSNPASKAKANTAR